MEVPVTPHAVYFDEETKTLMMLVVIDGHEIKAPLIVANCTDSLHNIIYTEEALRMAATKYNENREKRSHGEKEITTFS